MSIARTINGKTHTLSQSRLFKFHPPQQLSPHRPYKKMLFLLVAYLFFHSPHSTSAYEAPRMNICNHSPTYNPNGTFSTTLTTALTTLQTITAATGFSTTTITNPTTNTSVTALALCCCNLPTPDCQACVVAASLGTLNYKPDLFLKIYYLHNNVGDVNSEKGYFFTTVRKVKLRFSIESICELLKMPRVFDAQWPCDTSITPPRSEVIRELTDGLITHIDDIPSDVPELDNEIPFTPKGAISSKTERLSKAQVTFLANAKPPKFIPTPEYPPLEAAFAPLHPPPGYNPPWNVNVHAPACDTPSCLAPMAVEALAPPMVALTPPPPPPPEWVESLQCHFDKVHLKLDEFATHFEAFDTQLLKIDDYNAQFSGSFSGLRNDMTYLATQINGMAAQLKRLEARLELDYSSPADEMEADDEDGSDA
ncbi:hypothetical protein RHGRI_028757 [Rhododendron griersonianum]|uniref:Gnk2-homologous domain-containing protein n=1 Tax=Rhododendron griersonianum TaxID=479676 RepID=A0AAV6IGY3_9ERIC|nr:hypothetical protein RHGRI_028757 [Rhododendron griersonianum]